MFKHFLISSTVPTVLLFEAALIKLKYTLTGTWTSASHFGCERCVCRGAYISGYMRFLCVNAKRRTWQDWHLYRNKPNKECTVDSHGYCPDKKSPLADADPPLIDLVSSLIGIKSQKSD